VNYLINPNARRFQFVATALTALSHHDPAQNRQSNISLFRRADQVVERQQSAIPTNDDVKAFIGAFRVPESLAPFLANLTPAQFLAICFVQKFIKYNNGDGLMEGVNRYTILSDRVKVEALNATGGFSFWARLNDSMRTDGDMRADDGELLRLLTAPQPIVQLALDALSKDTASVVALARMWRDAVSQPKGWKDGATENWDEQKHIPHVPAALQDQQFKIGARVVMPVPAVSANSLRHEMLREPAMWHLLTLLDVTTAEMPDGAAALLYNGGDLSEGEPGDAFKLTRKVRNMYPSLDLLGGSTKGFILGSSNVEVSAWLVCKENAAPLQRFDITPDLSAFDLLTRVEFTRHTNKRVAGSPMPFGFEALAQGAQIAVEIRLRPYTTELVTGALVAALDTYKDADSTAFGQSARGFGLLDLKTIRQPEGDLAALRGLYEDYVTDNAFELRAGLVSGRLTTDKVVI
jgi:hypothetical protein